MDFLNPYFSVFNEYVFFQDRLKQSKAHLMDDWVPSYEQAQAGVATFRQQYFAKVRKADEADDE